MATKLIVDDSPAILHMMELTLKTFGHKVIDAVNGFEALSKAEQVHIDMVITDVNMPKMDGITLIGKLRELPQYRYTPMLVLTTESSPEKKLEGKAAGATGWLVKPFNPEQLLAAIKKVLP
jgi:two-component system chemotaxis response regulator CheY